MSTPDAVVEATEKLRETANLIQRFGRHIVLHRPTAPASDGAGGVLQPAGEAPLDEQVFFVGGKINDRMNNLPFLDTSSIGEYRRIKLVLLGMPIEMFGLKVADIEKNDWFVQDGMRFTVDFVQREAPYEVKAECLHVRS